MNAYVGADYSFRRWDLNKLFCKPPTGVNRVFLNATQTASAKEKIQALFAKAKGFQMLTSAPALV